MDVYQADPSLKGKLRRRFARLAYRRPVSLKLERPMVTFSFDDAPVSAAVAGAQALESRGVLGTYYVSAGLADQDGPMGRYAGASDAQRLHAAGHEIACHTFSHLDCGRADAGAIDGDVGLNTAALAGWDLPRAVSFAYPYGDVSSQAKRALGGRFMTLRALHHGLVEDGTDANQAPAVGIEDEDGEAVALAWLERARARNGWLILYTHDVAQNPSSWGCTPDALARLIDRALADGFEVVTAAEGGRRAGLTAG